MRLNWDDLYMFLVIARAGRLTAAARRLNMNHATLSRRVTRMEAALGCLLFDRLPLGYALTDAGLALLKNAEAMEALALDAQSRLSTEALGLIGTIRIGCPEAFGNYILAPSLVELRMAHPGMEIELVAEPHVANLSRREADIIITSAAPGERRVSSQRIAEFELGFYASPTYLRNRAAPESLADLRHHDLISYIDDLLPTHAHAYLGQLVPEVRAAVRVSNSLAQFAAVSTGAGICILPRFVAESRPGLVRVLPDIIAARRAYWCVVHDDQANLARIRVVAAFLNELITRHQASLLY